MNQDYIDLKSLEKLTGYQKLEALWILQVSKIEEKRDSAGSKSQESAWRYWAGMEKGFKLAMTARQRAIADMEQKENDLREESVADKILEEMKLKGESL